VDDVALLAYYAARFPVASAAGAAASAAPAAAPVKR